jgi:hypothetical protein
VSEYWIWSNQFRGWRGRRRGEYTLQLHLAGRFAEHIAVQYVKNANDVIGDTDYPIEVMIEVNNMFLSRRAQQLMAEYEKTGDRAVFDNAYFAAQDQELLTRSDLQESLAQMMRGEGREIDLNELGEGHGV